MLQKLMIIISCSFNKYGQCTLNHSQREHKNVQKLKNRVTQRFRKVDWYTVHVPLYVDVIIQTLFF